MKERMEYRTGFLIYDSGKNGPLFVAPHSGLPLKPGMGMRDIGTENAAFLCAENAGCSVISTVGRERTTGIDFYRLVPSLFASTSIYGCFKENSASVIDFKEKYAWAAKDSEMHAQKKTIYDSFWNFVRNKKNSLIIFLHTQTPHIKNHPSLMDIITYEGRGFSNSIIKSAIETMNKKYENKFAELSQKYNKYALDFVDLYAEHVENESGAFSLDKLNNFQKIMVEKDLAKIKSLCPEENYNSLIRNFGTHTFKAAVECVLAREKNIGITFEKNFKGRLAEYVVIPFLKQNHAISLQIEISEFLANRHPKTAAEIIWGLIDECRNILSGGQ